MKTKILSSVSALVVAGFLNVATADAAEMVVISSSGTPIEPGAVIDASKPIKLSEGASMTLLGPDGSPTTISGPYSGKLKMGDMSGGDGKVISALANLFADQKKSTASLGAVRSATASSDKMAPEPWLVSLEDSGDRCIQSANAATLWRANAEADSSFAIAGPYKKTKPQQWPAGHDRVDVPSSFFRDGQTYKAQLGSKVVELTMHVAKSDFKNTAEAAVWMAQSGCSNQAVSLLNTLK